MWECLAIFVVALAGGLLPLLVRWTDRLLHSALALSTGIFLGAVFLHLLPSLAGLTALHDAEAEVAAPSSTGAGGPGIENANAGVRLADDPEHERSTAGHAHPHGDPTLWFFVLLGVLAVYFIEALVFRTHDHDDLHRHRAVGYAALVGLSVHSLTTGIGFAAATTVHESLELPVFISIVSHKGFEAFSLTSVFLLASFSRKRVVGLTVLFSLVTPLGVVLGTVFTSRFGAHGSAIATALAAGTFLFVCLCELLPEVFHHREDGAVKIGLLAGGITLMALCLGAGA